MKKKAQNFHIIYYIGKFEFMNEIVNQINYSTVFYFLINTNIIETPSKMYQIF